MQSLQPSPRSRKAFENKEIMNDTNRVLLSGPGLIGIKHAQIISARKDSQLVGVVAPDAAENREFAQQYSIPLFVDFETAIKESNPTAVVISSPNSFHCEQAIIASDYSIPTLVEKPITENLADARRLIEVVEKNKTPFLVGHHRTHSDLVKTAIGFLQSENFGSLVALFGSALFYKPEQYFVEGPWRKVKGGGPLLINLIHEIGLWRMFAGDIKAVHASISNKFRNFEVEDSAAIIIEFQSGALGTFVLSDTAASSKSWEMTSGENKAFPFYKSDSAYHFAGTRGSLDFPTMATKYYADADEKSWLINFQEETMSRDISDPLEKQFEHFLAMIHNGIQPLVSARDGYANLLVLEAIRLSGNLNRRVELIEVEEISGSRLE